MATHAEILEMLIYWRKVAKDAVRPKHKKNAQNRVSELEQQLQQLERSKAVNNAD